MNTKIINEVAQGSLSGQLSFPEVVGKLLAEGFESYHVDLVRAENRYYKPTGENHVLPVKFDHPQAAENFSPGGVQAAVKRSQAKEIDYQKFLHLILSAGCVYYITYLIGRQVIYFGRGGEFHIEKFPTAK